MMSFRALARIALDIALPPCCAACDMLVGQPAMLCPACFAATAFITDPVCASCSLPFASAGHAGKLALCAICVASPPPWRAARAALMYEAQGRALVLKLKHADRQDIAAMLAQHMARAGRKLLAQADLLVPVPLHRWRRLRRGFNQSALLAQALSRASHVPPLLSAVRRVHRTPSLGPLSALSRQQVLSDAFTVPPRQRPKLAGRRVLLIDDVMTSGATAAACTRALLDAGALHVDVLVASRVADPRNRN